MSPFGSIPRKCPFCERIHLTDFDKLISSKSARGSCGPRSERVQPRKEQSFRGFFHSRKEAGMIVEINNGAAPTKEEIISLRYGGMDVTVCAACGRRIDAVAGNPSGGRPRRFCSDACRQRYWTAHPDKNGWNSYEETVCEYCKRSFRASRKGIRARRYCSRACANRARTLKWK